MLCVRRQVNTVMFKRKYMPCHNPSNSDQYDDIIISNDFP